MDSHIKMKYKIDRIDKDEYEEVVDVWEASVRSTHHFLKEEDIEYFKPLILHTYLDAVELRCVRIDQRIVGFAGVSDQNLEMLFIHPQHRGKGIGKVLLDHAVEALGVCKVDVNEQNEEAVGFYNHFGFKRVSRSEFDGAGKPYPILHLELRR